ncbi:mobile mystery protein B [bacterium]|nr:mobile mystery protein B [bacterium]
MGLNLSYTAGQTPLDEAETYGLKILSTSTQEELNLLEQINIEKAILWITRTRISKESILTAAFLKKLHKVMLGEVWNWAGRFRQTNKNIGVQWTMINVELIKLLADCNYWIAKKDMDSDEICIRFKHRLVSIHCFPNGNGRHSRIIADIMREILFDKSPFNWSRGTINDPRKLRETYINALKLADQGDIKALVEFARG